ncbi:hypothetical protein [Frateuria sp. YIM B11624]|uniref:hypothetical protein n=1 Tax=Frateuria sp. YIM B11624 TaxID=3143185 RepID=UPI003C710B84
MKSLLFLVALALPATAAATVAMESQRATSSSQDATQSGPATHRQLFIVKYVLRRPPADTAPQVTMDDPAPQIVPPSAGGYPTAALGALPRDPNTILCYGWGCEGWHR